MGSWDGLVVCFMDGVVVVSGVVGWATVAGGLYTLSKPVTSVHISVV